MEVRIKKLSEKALLPVYQTPGSSGADLHALLESDLKIEPFERVLVPTGLAFEIPQGFEVQVRPRSGLSSKHGITVINTPGTLDSDYRGEIKIPIVNLSKETFILKSGERIAQMVICPVIQAQFTEISELSSTERGSGGFGSTGS